MKEERLKCTPRRDVVHRLESCNLDVKSRYQILIRKPASSRRRKVTAYDLLGCGGRGTTLTPPSADLAMVLSERTVAAWQIQGNLRIRGRKRLHIPEAMSSSTLQMRWLAACLPARLPLCNCALSVLGVPHPG